MLDTNIQTCPACNSPNLWTDDHEGTTYKHCYECTFVWDSQPCGTTNQAKDGGTRTRYETSYETKFGARK